MLAESFPKMPTLGSATTSRAPSPEFGLDAAAPDLDYAALAQATETTPTMPESAVQVSATGVSSPRARPAAASSSPRSRSRNRKASSCSSVGDRGNGISGGKFWLAAANAAFAIDKPDPPYASSRVKAWPIPLRRPETVSTAAAPQGTHIPGTKSRTPTSAAQPKSPTSACPGPKPARAAVAVACSSPSSSCAARYGSRQSSSPPPRQPGQPGTHHSAPRAGSPSSPREIMTSASACLRHISPHKQASPSLLRSNLQSQQTPQTASELCRELLEAERDALIQRGTCRQAWDANTRTNGGSGQGQGHPSDIKSDWVPSLLSRRSGNGSDAGATNYSRRGVGAAAERLAARIERRENFRASVYYLNELMRRREEDAFLHFVWARNGRDAPVPSEGGAVPLQGTAARCGGSGGGEQTCGHACGSDSVANAVDCDTEEANVPHCIVNLALAVDGASPEGSQSERPAEVTDTASRNGRRSSPLSPAEVTDTASPLRAVDTTCLEPAASHAQPKVHEKPFVSMPIDHERGGSVYVSEAPPQNATQRMVGGETRSPPTLPESSQVCASERPSTRASYPSPYLMGRRAVVAVPRIRIQRVHHVHATISSTVGIGQEHVVSNASAREPRSSPDCKDDNGRPASDAASDVMMDAIVCGDAPGEDGFRQRSRTASSTTAKRLQAALEAYRKVRLRGQV